MHTKSPSIVIYKMIPFSEGAQRDAPATILEKSKLIVDIETGAIALAHQLNLHIISKQLIVIFESKIFLHFREDCRKFCEGDWDIPDENGLIGLGGIVRYNGIVGGSNGITNLIGLVGLIGPNGLIGEIKIKLSQCYTFVSEGWL